MSRFIVFLLMLSFCLPLVRPGGQIAPAVAPSVAMHAMLHEQDVEHHHHGQSHLFEVGSSEEAQRHLAEGLCAPHCCSLLPTAVTFPLANTQTASIISHFVTSLPEPYPDRHYRPPQA